MGDMRIEKMTEKERRSVDPDALARHDNSVLATNSDLDSSLRGGDGYALDKVQRDTLLVHARQDAAMANLQGEAILDKLKGIGSGVQSIQAAVWIIVILQIAQLAGCHL